MKYKLLRKDRAANKELDDVEFVYDFGQCDYGLSSEDTRYTGIEHISVTLNPEGGAPAFTIPYFDLQEV